MQWQRDSARRSTLPAAPSGGGRAGAPRPGPRDTGTTHAARRRALLCSADTLCQLSDSVKRYTNLPVPNLLFGPLSEHPEEDDDGPAAPTAPAGHYFAG